LELFKKKLQENYKKNQKNGEKKKKLSKCQMKEINLFGDISNKKERKKSSSFSKIFPIEEFFQVANFQYWYCFFFSFSYNTKNTKKK